MSLAVETCPFLGCTEDRDSVCGYATAVNVCYALPNGRRRYRGASISRQESHCLASYQGCERYHEGLARLGSGTPVPVRLSFMRSLFQRLTRLLSSR